MSKANHEDTINDLQKAVNALEKDALRWTFFTHLPRSLQLDMIESYKNPFALNRALAELMDRPANPYEYPGNDERLFEEAGIEADTYRGGGWFALRTMLINFHKRCQALKI
jgi:hypothetical protein